MAKITVRLAGAVLASVLALSATVTSIKAEQFRVPDSPCFWERLDWDQLRNNERLAWMVLGWNGMRWDSDDSSWTPASESKDWAQLTPREKHALHQLGYSEDSWDNFDTSSCFGETRITQRVKSQRFGAGGETRDTFGGPGKDNGLED